MKKQHLLFASYEIHPVTAGGCGVFLWHAINELLRTTDYKITLLLDIPKFECEEFVKKYKVNMPNHNNLDVICLSDRIPTEYLPMESFGNIFLFKSYMFYRVLEQLVSEKQIDYVEFFDYVGIGYFSINAKKYENKFKNTLLGIRGHCTVDLMDLEQRQIDFSQDKIEMYQMEKISLQNADVVLVQTESWKELYARRYGINANKIIVAEPPMDNSDFPEYKPKDNKNVLFYGRVFELKGIDEYIQAGIQYLRKNPLNKETKFYIVGYDGKTVEGKSYTEYIKSFIPLELKERFIFTGKLDRQEFKNILDNISIAVFPNYVESFCYSIHEIYEAGVPIICRAIPAFTSYFNDSQNCLMYKGGISELTEKITLLLASKELREKLSCPYITLKRIDQKIKYNEILNMIPDVEKSEETKESRLSIVYVNNYIEEIDFKLYIEQLKDKRLGITSFLNVYINPDFKPRSEMMKVNFLGREVYVQAINTESLLSLEEAVAIVNIEDEISEDFLKRAQRILENNNINYVMAAYKNANNHYIYPKYSLYKENSYNIYSTLENMVINNSKGLALNELFDFRCGLYGQLEYLLHAEGYVIPDTFDNRYLSTISIEGAQEQLIFTINYTKRNKQWKPFDIYGLLENKVGLGCETQNLSKKRLYHNIRGKLYQSDSKLSRISLKYLEYIKKVYLSMDKLIYRYKDRG